MRYALAGLLALVIGSQADAQLIRRYSRPYNAGYAQSYYSSPSYATPGVVTAGYYSPYASPAYVYPSNYYSTPTVGFGVNFGYPNLGYSNYSNYGYGNRYYGGGSGRRGYRW